MSGKALLSLFTCESMQNYKSKIDQIPMEEDLFIIEKTKQSYQIEKKRRLIELCNYDLRFYTYIMLWTFFL